uniref:Uncharacterized protein n=1 Tax=Oryza sativa subsp. japonica TaxID=39947 RepID=Q10CH9_ORYSJ|nr:hypothetical protein LOC_Os03g56942 [Oryza sativa Japonica Group]
MAVGSCLAAGCRGLPFCRRPPSILRKGGLTLCRGPLVKEQRGPWKHILETAPRTVLNRLSKGGKGAAYKKGGKGGLAFFAGGLLHSVKPPSLYGWQGGRLQNGMPPLLAVTCEATAVCHVIKIAPSQIRGWWATTIVNF